MPLAEPELRCVPQQFELAVPLRNARQEWRSRNTLIVELADGHGLGRGEAAPLPGYSRDEPDGAERVLLAIPRAALGECMRLSQPAELLGAAESLIPAEYPAARFALETALLDRLGRQQGRPLWSLLRELLPARGAPGPVPVCVLLSGAEPGALLSEASRHHGRGVRCFKLKIGPDRLQPEQAQLLAQLRANWGEQVELRLDANQSLLRAELPGSFERLASYRPEFIEEPLAEPNAVALAALPCGWALDESLQRLEPEQIEPLLRAPGCRALVLKPTCLGGFGRCIALAAQAWAHGKAAVVSHSFEGPIGWLACAQLAIALGPAAAAGIWPPAFEQNRDELVSGGWLQPLPRPGLGAKS
jgi:o-succinylbenzoate synthase